MYIYIHHPRSIQDGETHTVITIYITTIEKTIITTITSTTIQTITIVTTMTILTTVIATMKRIDIEVLHIAINYFLIGIAIGYIVTWLRKRHGIAISLP